MDNPQRMEMQSADNAQINLDALYQIAPSCFTETRDEKTGKVRHTINFTKLRELLGDNADDDIVEAYEFNWVGKQSARAEVLKPINKTLRPVKEDSVDWDNTKNLYIEGDNLEVLKLLQKSYLGKVKMIYIDPPYNTGNDFVYHDDFKKSQKEEDLFSGAIDEEGNRFVKNTESNGRFHSDWCSMIYSRLMIARTLLSEDGVIFISIDDNEVENLLKICDEIFGRDNRVENVIWKNKYGAGAYTVGFISAHEYILCYSKNPITNITCEFEGEERDKYNKRDEKYATRGPYRTQPLMTNSLGDRPNLMYSIYYNGVEIKPKKQWVWSKERMEKAIANNDVEFTLQKDGSYSVRSKAYLIDENGDVRRGKPVSILNGPFTQEGTEEMRDLFGGKTVFDFTKPSKLIEYLLKLEVNDKKDKDFLVLDFFSGSGTTASAVMKANNSINGKIKYILVQLGEETQDDTEAKRAGFNNICEIGKERIRRAGKKILDDLQSEICSLEDQLSSCKKVDNPQNELDLFNDDETLKLEQELENKITTIKDKIKNLDTGFRVFRVDSSNYEDVEVSPNELKQDGLNLFENNIKKDRTGLDLLFSCMLDWGVQLSVPMQSDVVDGATVYNVNNGDLLACFDHLTKDVISKITELQPLRVVFRDSCFHNDAEKINLYELFKQSLNWSDQEVYNNIRVI